MNAPLSATPQQISPDVTKSRLVPVVAPYLFLMPFLVLFVVFLFYPLVQSVMLAFKQTSGPRSAEFVGLSNFKWMLTDPDFWTAVKNTTVFAGASLLIQLPCALGLAMLLNRKDVKGRAFWRMIFFAPSLVGLAFMAVLSMLLFASGNGLVNTWLYDISFVVHQTVPFLFPRQWVWDPEFAWLQEYVMPALIITAFWMYVGFNMVYFLAALQNVNQDLLEAASVDGATAWHRFIHVTIPAIRPVGSFVVLLSMIGSFQLFELPYLLLNSTAGPNNQGLTVVMYLYDKGFDAGDLGYASAVGWVLAILLFTLAIVQRVVAREDGR